MRGLKYLLVGLIWSISYEVFGQKTTAVETTRIHIDKEGIMRWQGTEKEALFFGVNYTAPFAHAYRAHKQLEVDLEEAIRKDVYHLARLGINAFRVHVWDVEISDREGNLLENEHLRLFDFLLAELKKRGIYVLITPIAFWGNGYPEPDDKLPGFSAYYGKAASTVNKEAIKAQERYLKQFFNHKNPYTGLTYGDDPNVIATEINNEPDHNGDEKQITTYINTLQKAIKSTGWDKPVFYNISQNPSKAAAVAQSAVDGYSFQWYPVGLVAGHTLKGNFLPNVDRYTIPFDTIPAFLRKPKMVYEFDAADQVQPILFPAMARSFRQAGFQWATQFAYDPLSIAYANTEYQTHYLNLAYTPAKAISLLIAGQVFRSLPSGRNYGVYPVSSMFASFRLDFEKQLSEMNVDTAFYYTATTASAPANATHLKHIAGVGSSACIQYQGTGAYFLDKLQDGRWRLEVMPDVISLEDPFERPSLKKEVNRVVWNKEAMTITLGDVGDNFQVKGLNKGNNMLTVAEGRTVVLSPGTYLVVKKGLAIDTDRKRIGMLGLEEFIAPMPVTTDLYVSPSELWSGNDSSIVVNIAGNLPQDSLFMEIERLRAYRQLVPLKRLQQGMYAAAIPLGWQKSGRLNYRVWIKREDHHQVFPGNHRANPKQWDYFPQDWWTLNIQQGPEGYTLFHPVTDQFLTYPSHTKSIQYDYVFSPEGGGLVLHIDATKNKEGEGFGLQVPLQQKPLGKTANFKDLVIKARSSVAEDLPIQIGLIDASGQNFSKEINLRSDWQLIKIPIASLKPGKSLLLPRPYPGFLPLWFSTDQGTSINLKKLDKLQLFLTYDNIPANAAFNWELGAVWLE
jgi:hypothetical protein